MWRSCPPSGDHRLLSPKFGAVRDRKVGRMSAPLEVTGSATEARPEVLTGPNRAGRERGGRGAEPPGQGVPGASRLPGQLAQPGWSEHHHQHAARAHETPERK